MVQLRNDLIILSNQIPTLRKSDMMVSSQPYRDYGAITKTGIEFVIIKDSKSSTFVLSESQVQTLYKYLKDFMDNANI